MTTQVNDADAPERTDDRIRQYLNLARKCWRRAPIFLEDGNFRRACGQGWGAVTMLTKAVAIRRGLAHDGPDHIRDAIVELRRELTDRARMNAFIRATGAAEALYGKFYDVTMDTRMARLALDDACPLMEFLWEQLPVAYTAGASFDEFCQLLGSDYDLKDQEYRRAADGRAVLRNRRIWRDCLNRMGVPEVQIISDAYSVSRGIRPLVLVSEFPNDPAGVKDALQALSVIRRNVESGGHPPAIPFVRPKARAGKGTAEVGYASHRWIIETYDWVDENAPEPHRERLVGLLLGYSCGAVAAPGEQLLDSRLTAAGMA